MALIKCPECGKEFSSYAMECPQCGFPVGAVSDNGTSSSITCPECGETIDADFVDCPNCGCPINESFKADNTVEHVKPDNTSKRFVSDNAKQERTKMLGAFLVVVLIGFIIFAVLSVKDNNIIISKTKKELIGKWSYSGNSSTLTFIWFYRDNRLYMKQLTGFQNFEVQGTYSVHGRDVYMYWKNDDGEDRTGTLRLSEDHNLYAGDGTKYVKVEDY